MGGFSIKNMHINKMWTKLNVPRVISLYDRKDRQAEVIEETKKLGMKFTFHLVHKNTESGKRGCFESHVNLSKLNKHEKYLFVLEDDFELNIEDGKVLEDVLSEIKQFMDKNSWDLLYLGVLPNFWTANSYRQSKHIFKTVPFACTHAYFISQKYMEEVATWQYDNKAIDVMYRECKNAYAVYPQIFKQRASKSDIVHFITPCPPFLRDVPVNFSNWYAHNVGVSLLNVLFVLIIISFLIKYKLS